MSRDCKSEHVDAVDAFESESAKHSTTPLLRISKKMKQHPKFGLFNAVYGIGLLTSAIDEDKAQSLEPCENTTFRRLQQDQTTHSAKISLCRTWSYSLDCDHTCKGPFAVPLDDLEILTQMPFPFEKSTIGNIQLLISHQGFQKRLHAQAATTTSKEMVAVAGGTSSLFQMSVGKSEAALVDIKQPSSIVHDLWKAQTSEQFKDALDRSEAPSLTTQLQNYLLFVFYCLQIKIERNQIHFRTESLPLVDY